jgi:hypothetical protein
VSVAASVVYALGVQPTSAPVPPTLASSTQFDITGFATDAKLDCGTYPDTHVPALLDPTALCGGTVTVNGHQIIIPAETIVILPANALGFGELFTQAPAPYGPTQTGMALNDSPAPLTTHEWHITGNRVFDPNGQNGCAVALGCALVPNEP